MGLLKTLLFTSLVGVCTLYSIMTFEYGWYLRFENAPQLWYNFLARITSPEFAFGRGSVFLESTVEYAKGLAVILPHSMLGSIALFIGPWQFVSAIRDSFMTLHRWAGFVFFGAHALSLCGAFIFLVTTPASHLYSGTGFAFALWGLFLIATFSLVKAYLAIQYGDVTQHSAWTALDFAMVTSAMWLRTGWILVRLFVCPTCTMADMNQSVATPIIPLTTLAAYAFIASRTTSKGTVGASMMVGRSWATVASWPWHLLSLFFLFIGQGNANQYYVRFLGAAVLPWWDLYSPGLWATRAEVGLSKTIALESGFGFAAGAGCWVAAILAPRLAMGLVSGGLREWGTFQRMVVVGGYGVSMVGGGVGLLGWWLRYPLGLPDFGAHGLVVHVFFVGLWWGLSAVAVLLWRAGSGRASEVALFSVTLSFFPHLHMLALWFSWLGGLDFRQAFMGCSNLTVALPLYFTYVFVVAMRYSNVDLMPYLYKTRSRVSGEDGKKTK